MRTTVSPHRSDDGLGGTEHFAWDVAVVVVVAVFVVVTFTVDFAVVVVVDVVILVELGVALKSVLFVVDLSSVVILEVVGDAVLSAVVVAVFAWLNQNTDATVEATNIITSRIVLNVLNIYIIRQFKLSTWKKLNSYFNENSKNFLYITNVFSKEVAIFKYPRF